MLRNEDELEFAKRFELVSAMLLMQTLALNVTVTFKNTYVPWDKEWYSG